MGRPVTLRRPSPHHLRIDPGIVVDARRAVWIPEERTLLVADVHLGYAWVERRRGLLLPLAPEDTLERLMELVSDYSPRACVFLGDTLHAAAELDVLTMEVRRLAERMSDRCEIRFVLGNHDQQLPKMLGRMGLNLPCGETFSCGRHLLLHGHRAWPAPDAGWTFQGHEHPAVTLGDGVTTTLKAPCFLVGRRRLVLPAFSTWAAGQAWRRAHRADGNQDEFRRAIAILGGRLLPVEL